jgi:hypothetical protein
VLPAAWRRRACFLRSRRKLLHQLLHIHRRDLLPARAAPVALVAGPEPSVSKIASGRIFLNLRPDRVLSGRSDSSSGPECPGRASLRIPVGGNGAVDAALPSRLRLLRIEYAVTAGGHENLFLVQEICTFCWTSGVDNEGSSMAYQT